MRTASITLLVFVTFFVVSSYCLNCTHPIYCVGPVLAAVQMAQVFNDSKTFVDMPLRYPFYHCLYVILCAYYLFIDLFCYSLH